MAQPGTVVLVSSGTMQTGGWCSACLLPSRVKFPVYITTENGSMPIATVDACTECGDGIPR
jgi:hypothetical protein